MDIGPGDPTMKEQSERVIVKRLLNSTLPIDNKPAIDVLKSVSKKSGLSVPFLAANALQEGMNNVLSKNSNLGKHGETYPINGYEYYGLDTFGDAADRLIKKGYLPVNFDYQKFGEQNEHGTEITSARFKNNEDALMAKAAYLRDFQDSVNDYASKKKVKLDKYTQEYLTMSAYNGGMNNAKTMIDELATGRFNQRDYVSRGQTSMQGIHKNIKPRLQKQSWIDEDFMQPQQNPFPMFTDLMSSIR